jgi:hypothetical protein
MRRTAGFLLAGQFVLGFVISMVMFNAFDWGTSPYDIESARKAVIENFAEAAIFFLASFLGYFLARSVIKGASQPVNQPGEGKTS